MKVSIQEDMYEVMRALPGDQGDRLARALLDYGFTGEQPERCNDPWYFAFLAFAGRIEMSAKSSAYGSQGSRKRWGGDDGEADRDGGGDDPTMGSDEPHDRGGEDPIIGSGEPYHGVSDVPHDRGGEDPIIGSGEPYHGVSDVPHDRGGEDPIMVSGETLPWGRDEPHDAENESESEKESESENESERRGNAREVGVARDADVHDASVRFVSRLNELTGSSFSPDSAATLRLVSGRLRDGYGADDLCSVAEVKCSQWKRDQRMRGYLRPETLLRPTKFEGYLQEARAERGRASPFAAYDVEPDLVIGGD